MPGLGRLNHVNSCHRLSRSAYRRPRNYSTRSCDPLRILFCGSDKFSIPSLNALYMSAQEDPSFIASIEVISRPGKWTGPYKKLYKEVPIAERARSLNLPLHQIDTFRGWIPPVTSAFNLIIAVSFGLLIPRRLIEGAKYGGLNVHPSMLPDLYGPAPLQHTLLENDKYAGLTVQTLHPTTMDKGAILAQTNSPGLEISDKARESFSSFIDYMAPYGADLLVKTLKQDLYKGPIQVLTRSRLHGRRPRHARKLDIEDRHIDWAQWPADKIIRHQKLLKTLWNNFEIDEVSIKLVWSGDFGIAKSTEHDSAIVPGTAYISTDGNSWVINTVDGKAIAVYECTVAGDESRNVNHTTKKYSMSEDENGSTRRLRTVFK